MTEKIESAKSSSSLDLLWDQAFRELDAWANRAKYRDEVLLQSAEQLVEGYKRGQKNLQELVEQFSKEFQEWERKSKEELITATASLQYIFPLKSFEEINHQLDSLQNKTSSLISSTFHNFVNPDYANNFKACIEQYVDFRHSNRTLFVENVKNTAALIRDNQKVFVDILSNQVKYIFFPFQKYLQRSEEMIKQMND